MSMHIFRCVLCGGGPNATVVHSKIKGDEAGRFEAVSCDICGHIQLNPPEYSLDFYEEDGQVNAVVRNYGTPMSVLVEHSWTEAKRRVERFGLRGVPLGDGTKPVKILDIGGGYGFFASEFMKTYPHITVDVVEPSATRAELGRKLIAERGSDAPLPAFIVELIDDDFVGRHRNTYDIVTMWHVLEHIIEPIPFLAQAAALATEAGIVCVEVPNADDELMTLSSGFKDRWFMTEHISYFHKRTLALVGRNAWKNASIDVYGYQRYGIFNYFSWIHTNKPQGANPDLFEAEDRWWLEATWRAAREAALTSDAIFMVMRKVSAGPLQA